MIEFHPVSPLVILNRVRTALLRAILPSVLGLIVASGVIQAQDKVDKITFANGDITTGTLTSVDHDHVIFQGSLTGTMNYRWSDIASLSIQSSFGIGVIKQASISEGDSAKISLAESLPAARHALAPSTLNSAENSEAVVGANNTMQAVVLKQADPSAPGVIPSWGGSVSTQNQVTRATQDQYQLSASAHISFETQQQAAWKHQFVSFDSTDNFSESLKAGASPTRIALFRGTLMYEVEMNNSDLQGNYPPKLNSFFLFGFADGYRNLSLGIDTQQSYGGGIGWTLTLRGKPEESGQPLVQVLGIQGDMRYAQQNLYSPGVGGQLGGSGINEHYAVSIPAKINPRMKPIVLSEDITAVPYFNNTRSFQTFGSSVLLFPLTDKLSIGPKVDDDYFRNAPHTSKQNYLQPSLNLTYNFTPQTK